MIQEKSDTNEFMIPPTSLGPFLLMTFGLAWGILAAYMLLPAMMTSVFGRISGNHPLFFLAVYAPALSAFLLVIRRSGLSGLRRFFARLRLWRCSTAWAVFLIIGLPLVFYAGAALKGTLFSEPFAFSSFSSLLIALLLSAVKGPMEEFGWRGFALPLLQRWMAPIWASLVLGFIWGVWHLPAFLLSGTQQSTWSFLPFLAGTVVISVIMTALFNASRGSILLAAFMHFQLMNPIWPDAQPYDTYILAGIAVLVVGLNHKAMFTRKHAVVHVVSFRNRGGEQD